MVSAYALVAASVPKVGVAREVILLLPMSMAPVMEPPDLDSLVAMLLETVVAKLGSSLIASASSLRVSRVDGAEATRLEIAVST